MISLYSIYLSPPLPAGQMTDLIYTEKELVQSLKDYIQAEESKLAAVKRSEVTASHHATPTWHQTACHSLISQFGPPPQETNN